MTLFYIAFETLRQVGTQRYDPGLAELGIPDQQRVLDEVGIGQLETCHFSNPQSQPVEQSEHRLSKPALDAASVVLPTDPAPLRASAAQWRDRKGMGYGYR